VPLVTPTKFPEGAKEGDFVSGEFRINLPNSVLGVPDELILTMGRKWQVNGVIADMAQWVSLDDNSKPAHWKESEIPYQEVESTADSGRCRGYVLRCTELA
jgi:hypothetical protein